MEIEYLDRQGKKHIENAPGSGFLHFLYGGNPIGKFSLWVLVKRRYFSALFGKYMSSKSSAARIAPFIEKHKMDMSPYIEPKVGYKSFNEFFYRKIKPEFRPIGKGFVSPADGRTVVIEDISSEKKFYIKGKSFNLSTFLNNEELARKYVGGSMVVVRLAPVDYHRYHFPADGLVGRTALIKGAYYSVSPIALRRNWSIFWKNQRSICVQHSEEFGDLLISEIGATLTGSIVSTHPSNLLCNKGSEKGHFDFGGSTVLVLIEKGRIKWDEDIVKNSEDGFETYVKMGERLGVSVDY
jgi:phosphatidylserine decarboxylase